MARSQYNWTLAPEISARLGSESWGAQRTIFEADQLLLILHAPPLGAPNEREHEVFLRSQQGKWLYKGKERGEKSLREFFDDYRALLEKMEKRFAGAHDIDALFVMLDELIPLARSSNNAKLALQSAREAVRDDTFIITMRDRSVDVARGFELLLADARLALEFRMARSAELQARAAEAGNRAQQKLNVLAAIAFPLMTIAALFGMSLPNGLEAAPVIVFWLVFALGLVLGLVVKSWVLAATPALNKRLAEKRKP